MLDSTKPDQKTKHIAKIGGKNVFFWLKMEEKGLFYWLYISIFPLRFLESCMGTTKCLSWRLKVLHDEKINIPWVGSGDSGL